MTMSSHDDQIAMLLEGDSLDPACRVSLDQQIIDRAAEIGAGLHEMQVRPEPVPITFWFQLRLDFTEGRVRRPQGFDSMENDKPRIVFAGQIGRDLQGVIRTSGEVGGMEYRFGKEHG